MTLFENTQCHLQTEGKVYREMSWEHRGWIPRSGKASGRGAEGGWPVDGLGPSHQFSTSLHMADGALCAAELMRAWQRRKEHLLYGFQGMEIGIWIGTAMTHTPCNSCWPPRAPPTKSPSPRPRSRQQNKEIPTASTQSAQRARGNKTRHRASVLQALLGVTQVWGTPHWDQGLYIRQD